MNVSVGTDESHLEDPTRPSPSTVIQASLALSSQHGSGTVSMHSYPALW